jgi:hypothetical protein
LRGGGVKVMTVSHLKQENVSSWGALALDLLPTIAIPQSGQCFG